MVHAADGLVVEDYENESRLEHLAWECDALSLRFDDLRELHVRESCCHCFRHIWSAALV